MSSSHFSVLPKGSCLVHAHLVPAFRWLVCVCVCASALEAEGEKGEAEGTDMQGKSSRKSWEGGKERMTREREAEYLHPRVAVSKDRLLYRNIMLQYAYLSPRRTDQPKFLVPISSIPTRLEGSDQPRNSFDHTNS